MTRSQALEQLRRYSRLTLVRGHWCVEHRRKPPEYDEVLSGRLGQQLLDAKLARLENGGRELVPA